jgi:hypothetical protein
MKIYALRTGIEALDGGSSAPLLFASQSSAELTVRAYNEEMRADVPVTVIELDVVDADTVLTGFQNCAASSAD